MRLGVVDVQADAGANRRAVGFRADQLEFDPVVAEARVLEDGVHRAVAGVGAAELFEDVLVAVVVDVGKGDAVA